VCRNFSARNSGLRINQRPFEYRGLAFERWAQRLTDMSDFIALDVSLDYIHFGTFFSA